MNQLRTIGLALVALLLLVRAASADPVTFSYSIFSTSVWNNNSPAHVGGFLIEQGGTASPGGLTLFVLPGTASNWSPSMDPLGFTNVPITVPLTLTDDTAKAVTGAVPKGTMTFNGYVSGTLFGAQDVSNFTFAWDHSAQSITLGSPGQFHTFTVAAPTWDGQGLPKTYQVHTDIEASNYQPGIDPAPGSVSSVSAAPEPASLALAAIAVPALVLIRCKRRQRSMPG